MLQWAQRRDAWIVEDDYDGEFRYGQRLGVYPLSSLFAMPPPQGRTRPAGLVLGYASLTPRQVAEGTRIVGAVIAATAAAALEMTTLLRDLDIDT